MSTQTTTSASERITAEVTSWEGVTAGTGKRGELAFKVGGREIGHLHGDHAAHFFFPHRVWRQVRKEGRVDHHPVFPDREGPAARRIESEEDVVDVIRLMRMKYEETLARGIR
jgi:hypothetical protein